MDVTWNQKVNKLIPHEESKAMLKDKKEGKE